MEETIFGKIAKIEGNNQTAALCTVVRSRGSTPRGSASKMIVFPNGEIQGTVGGGEMENRVITEAIEVIHQNESKYIEYNMVDPERGDPGVCGGQVEIFIEPINPRPLLLVIGGGHVGRAVSRLGSWLGFRVVMSDDRIDYCNPENNPHAEEFYPVLMEDLPGQLEITPWTYIVLTTRGVDIDVPGLPGLLQSKAAYFGVIGSRRRWATTCEKLREIGINDRVLAKVNSPVGLDIHAESPEEIAVSIMAEIIMLRRGGDGKPMVAPS
jgi:xanthine dehydrogenase accessory factor